MDSFTFGVHELTSDGRERHYFVRIGDTWICECGLARDKAGRDVREAS